MRSPVCSALLILAVSSCQATQVPVLRYAGSSTLGHFIRDAAQSYDDASFEIDVSMESGGAELAILEGLTDLAGMACRPDPETLAAGVAAVQLGRDAIAVIVHPDNPLGDLDLEELRALFAGRVNNWRQLGGPDLAVRPLTVSSESATRQMFRSTVLGQQDYAGCETVRPDAAMVQEVAQNPGAIGPISTAFLKQAGEQVKIVAVAGELPDGRHPDYPIARPLYLLYWPARGRVDAFARWSQGPQGQRLIQERFAASVPPGAQP
jgi:phosphate transport system substrate-binding protein